jgi:NAD(P)-dependent dehydrogenase (short-subunit alcohol dehydrogenase family)
MAEFGADVVCCDISESKARETADLISSFGYRTLAIKADISKPDEVEFMVNKTVAKMGTLDILVNNAGISTIPAKVHELSIEDWDRAMAVNLKGVFLCIRAALPVMIKQKKGCIINISSVAAIRATNPKIFPHTNYSVSKAGVISLTRQAAAEYAKDGIRVNCIVLGFHRGTSLGAEWRASWPEEKRQRWEEIISKSCPMGRTGKPSEVKGLAIYLASDASSFVTGQTFVQDGGQSL